MSWLVRLPNGILLCSKRTSSIILSTSSTFLKMVELINSCKLFNNYKMQYKHFFVVWIVINTKKDNNLC